MNFVSAFALVGLLASAVAALPASRVELAKRASRTSTPSGCLTVRGLRTKSGEYSTISSALSALGTSSTASACIFIYGGTYSEQITVEYKGPLTIYGYSTSTGSYKSNTVTITHGESSEAAGSLDASSTANIISSNFKAYNLNFVNTYGAGAQAVAVTANGNKQGYYGCQFSGYQDTLYAKAGDQYYSNCLVVGADDYIFGDAAAWFGECDIESNGGGSITANSREESSDPAWYVFDHSNIKAASGYTATEGVYLGRPWRVLARVIYQYCTMTDIINPKGWTTMAAGATPIYEEYENTGAGSSTSEREYETTASGGVSKSTLWPNSGTSWIDDSY